MKADELTYDSKKNIIYIKGNIEFKIQDQYLISSEIRYDFKSKKGYILESYGSINFDTLGSIELDNKKFKKIDFKEKEKFIRNVTSNNSNNLGFSSKKVELELNEIQKWRFQAKKIEIDNDNWFSKELFLTNDPYNKPQVIIKNQNFQVNNKSKEIVIKTKWSSLVIEDKLSIPLGPRR